MKDEKLAVRVGKSAIYKWLYSEYGKEYCQYLCTRKTHKKKQSKTPKRHLIPNRKSLRDRPHDELQVHGESDLFVSPAGLHTKTVGHLTGIPSTHLLTGNFLPSKSPTVMNELPRPEGTRYHLFVYSIVDRFSRHAYMLTQCTPA